MRACISLFIIKTAEGLQYRIAGITGSLTSLVFVIIEILVYHIFYKYSDMAASGSLALSLGQIVTYSWFVQCLYGLQAMNVDGEILGKITSGDIGIELCRPMDLYSFWFSKTAASRLMPMIWRGTPMLILGAAATIIFPGMNIGMLPPFSTLNLVFMLLSLICAFFLCASFGMLVNVVRMSIDWGDGPTYTLMLIGNVLSGAYLPLQMWPDFMQRFLKLQPFAGSLDIPLRLYLGSIPIAEAGTMILTQILWTIIFILAGKALMSVKLSKIVVQGG